MNGNKWQIFQLGSFDFCRALHSLIGGLVYSFSFCSGSLVRPVQGGFVSTHRPSGKIECD